MKESLIQANIMLALSNNGCIVWRNESAGVWVGKPIFKDKGTVTLANAVMIRAGLCVGSSDIIGIHKATGKLLAIEVKTPTGRLKKEQQRFLEAIRNANGIAGVARTVEEALSLLP